MIFKVKKHILTRCVFYGGEFDYSIEISENSELLFDSIRSDKKIKIGKTDEKSLKIVDQYTFDRDSIKLNSLQKVKDNACKLVFRFAEEKVSISFLYSVAPFVVLILGTCISVLVLYIVNLFSVSKVEREDEENMLKKPKSFKK